MIEAIDDEMKLLIIKLNDQTVLIKEQIENFYYLKLKFEQSEGVMSITEKIEVQGLMSEVKTELESQILLRNRIAKEFNNFLNEYYSHRTLFGDDGKEIKKIEMMPEKINENSKVII